MSFLILGIVAVALSVKFPRSVEMVYYFVMINFCCYSALRVANEYDEDQYRFLVIIVVQEMFMHHVHGGLISVILTYASFLAFHSLLLGRLDAHVVFMKLLWMALQSLSTMAVHLLISAFGQMYVNSIVDCEERENSTAKQAENVIVLSQANHDDILFS